MHFSTTNKCFDSTQIYNQQQRIKINTTSTIATLSFFLLKISISTYLPIGAMIHKPLSPDGVHPPNQFVPEIVSPLPCSSGLVRHKLLFVYLFKELISFIGSLDKCHTSVFNALILPWDPIF